MEYGNLVIAFNGMIYNFRDIRQTLIQKGYKFHTETDTEVILAEWAEWQQDLLPCLHGMFAFALWGKAAKRLILPRDRFGKKPLYFRNWHGAFAFGSRFYAIEALTETARLSHEALSWLLTLKYIPDPFSASDEIQKLPAGHVLEITLRIVLNRIKIILSQLNFVPPTACVVSWSGIVITGRAKSGVIDEKLCAIRGGRICRSPPYGSYPRDWW